MCACVHQLAKALWMRCVDACLSVCLSVCLSHFIFLRELFGAIDIHKTAFI